MKFNFRFLTKLVFPLLLALGATIAGEAQANAEDPSSTAEIAARSQPAPKLAQTVASEFSTAHVLDPQLVKQRSVSGRVTSKAADLMGVSERTVLKLAQASGTTTPSTAPSTVPSTTTPGTTTPGGTITPTTPTTPGTVTPTTPDTTTPGGTITPTTPTTPGTITPTTPDTTTPGGTITPTTPTTPGTVTPTTPDTTIPATPDTTPSTTPGPTQDVTPTQQVVPGRATRSGSSYVGVGGNIGIGSGDTALGQGSFAVISKIGLTPQFSIRPSVLFTDDVTILVPVTYDFSFGEGLTGDLGFRAAPFLGVGAGISTGDGGEVGLLLTGGVDVPFTPQFTATASVNATVTGEAAVGILLGVGYNFTGF